MEKRKVPSVQFRFRENCSWVSRASEELFKGKRVVLFALPGAFTLVCSLVHLPGYEELYDQFKASGIDEIYCLAVNDGMVMNAWAENEQIKNVKMLPDAKGEFTKGLNLIFHSQELGERSKRYALIIDDGVIEEAFVEENTQSLGVASAPKVLKHLNPSFIPPVNVVVFTLKECIHCHRAKELLKSFGLKFSEMVYNDDYNFNTLKALSGGTTVPQIFIDGERLGGEEELKKWLTSSSEKD